MSRCAVRDIVRLRLYRRLVDGLLPLRGDSTEMVLIHGPLLGRWQLPGGLIQLPRLPEQLPRMWKLLLLLLLRRLLVKLLHWALPQAAAQMGSWLHAGRRQCIVRPSLRK
jgi:hypothetical protein